jgi:hypothetical protein
MCLPTKLTIPFFWPFEGPKLVSLICGKHNAVFQTFKPTFAVLPIGVRSLSLLSLNGRLVYTSNLTGNSEKLDIGDLVPGVYFLKMHSSSEVVLHKIIVQ